MGRYIEEGKDVNKVGVSCDMEFCYISEGVFIGCSMVPWW